MGYFGRFRCYLQRRKAYRSSESGLGPKGPAGGNLCSDEADVDTISQISGSIADEVIEEKLVREINERCGQGEALSLPRFIITGADARDADIAEFVDTDMHEIAFKLESGQLNYYVCGVLMVRCLTDLVLKEDRRSLSVVGTSAGPWLSRWCTTVQKGEEEIIERVMLLFQKRRRSFGFNLHGTSAGKFAGAWNRGTIAADGTTLTWFDGEVSTVKIAGDRIELDLNGQTHEGWTDERKIRWKDGGTWWKLRTCARGHELKACAPATCSDAWACDGQLEFGGCRSCTTGFAMGQSERFRCGICNYDLCKACLNSNETDPPPPSRWVV